jgi:signal transduction histidine kinase/DNA-binding response OmpR family regulator
LIGIPGYYSLVRRAGLTTEFGYPGKMLRNIRSDKPKAAQVKTGHTKIKVAAGYFLLFSLVLSLVYISLTNFYKIVNSVESLGNNRDESLLAKNLTSGIHEIRTSSKIYSISFDAADYKKYLQKRRSVHKILDSLTVELDRKNETEKADSLNAIFKEYITCISNWLALKKADKANDYKKLAEIIKEQDDSLANSMHKYPLSTTTVVTRLIEKPADEDSAGKEDETKSPARKSFFQRIFRSSKKEKETQPISSHLVNQQIITETLTQLDTGYYNQMNMILSKVKDTLTTTGKKKNIRETQLGRLEILLLNYQASLITEINHLLKNIEINENKVLAKKIMSSKQAAKNASKILVYAELLALIITLVFVYVIFRDLTKSAFYKERLEQEKLATEKLARAKEDFLATMSHEIRTPLTNIIGFSEQLESTPLNKNQERQVRSIVQSSGHLLSIVNDILDFNKIESGSLHFEKSGFSLPDVVNEVVESMQGKARKKGLQLFYQPRIGSESNLLSGDPFRLKQVLINLVSNSVKFTEKGYIRIETSVTENAPGYLLQCHVTDTGIGIAGDQLETIFKDYSQADSSIARKYGGTGLGLPISKKIVEMQNGSLQVKSAPGKGSVFSFEIPYAKALENEYNRKQVLIAMPEEKLKDKKILVIDDDSMMPLLLDPLFQRWHIRFTFCENSLKAWSLLQKEVYDIVMLDLQLLEMTGLELIKKITTEPLSRNKNAGIVVCTANVFVDQNKSNRLISDHLILYKPFKKDELWNVLCKSLETKLPANYSLKNFRTFANDETKTLVLFISTFILQTKHELAAMQNSFRQKEYSQVGEITHKLKNTFGQLESPGLLAILNSLETLTRTDNFEISQLEAQIMSLREACSTLFSSLEKEVEEMKTR